MLELKRATVQAKDSHGLYVAAASWYATVTQNPQVAYELAKPG